MSKKQNISAAIVAAIGMAVVATTAQAFTNSFFSPPLPGVTATDTWANFDSFPSTSYGGPFPGRFAWSGPMIAPTSTQASGQEAKLNKISGNGYPISDAPAPGEPIFLYMPSSAAPGSGPANYRLYDDNPVPNLRTVVFQLASGPGNVNAVDLTSPPVLNYNGGDQNLAATPTSGVIRYTEDGPDFLNPEVMGEAYRERYWQFDLTGVAGAITSFELLWVQPNAHTQDYSMRLDQSDTFVTVPEPASIGLIGAAGAMLTARRRRTR